MLFLKPMSTKITRKNLGGPWFWSSGPVCWTKRKNWKHGSSKLLERKILTTNVCILLSSKYGHHMGKEHTHLFKLSKFSLLTKKSDPWTCDLCLITSVAKNLYFVKNLTLKIVSYWESTKVTNTLKNEPGQSHQQNMVMTFIFEKSCLEKTIEK